MSLLPILLLSTALARTPPPTVAPGEPALAFALPAVNEETAAAITGRARVSLSDFTGLRAPHAREAVVLHFFDGRPAADLASLERIQKRYGNKGVIVLAVSLGDGDLGRLADWVSELKLGYPVLRDAHEVVAARYGIDDPPMTFIIDKNGHVFAIGQPDPSALEADLGKELDALIAK